MKEYVVYMHVFPNGKRYIGITCLKAEDRWANGFGYKTQYVFTAIVKYGWDNVEHYILFSGLTKGEAEEKERELIERLDTTILGNGYNVDLGDGIHSKETNAKIGQSKIGRHLSEEAKEMLRVAMTPERKKKMAEASSARCSIPVRCVETGVIYKNAMAANRETGIHPSTIGKCCKKAPKYKTAGGYHWEYANEK